MSKAGKRLIVEHSAFQKTNHWTEAVLSDLQLMLTAILGKQTEVFFEDLPQDKGSQVTREVSKTMQQNSPSIVALPVGVQ